MTTFYIEIIFQWYWWKQWKKVKNVLNDIPTETLCKETYLTAMYSQSFFLWYWCFWNLKHSSTFWTHIGFRTPISFILFLKRNTPAWSILLPNFTSTSKLKIIPTFLDKKQMADKSLDACEWTGAFITPPLCPWIMQRYCSPCMT